MSDNERNMPRWIWLPAILLLAILLFFFLRQNLFTSRQSERAQEDAKSAAPASSAPGRIFKIPSQTAESAPLPQFAPGASDSDSWYVNVAFKGVVRNEANRAPVDGATIRICAFSSPTTVLEKTTGGGGRFQAVAPPAYRYSVKVDAEGFRPYQDDSFVITRPYYEMEILLIPTLSLRGRVVDPLNAGIGDATVQMRRTDDRGPALLTVTTNAQGVFVFSEVPRSGRYFVEASHPGFESQGAATVSTPTEGDVVLRMTPSRFTGSLAGIVTDTAQQPAAGAKVSLFDLGDGRLLSSLLTDRQGLYKFSKMREGFYVVRCTAETSAETRGNQGAAAVYRDKESRFDCTVDPGLQIRGIVLNQKQEPVIQAQVTYGTTADMQRGRMPAADSGGQVAGRMNQRGGMQRPRNLGFTSTDNEGRFQIAGLADGQYQVSVSHRDYQSLVASLRPSNESQTLILDAGLSLRGTVSDVRGVALGTFTLTFQSISGRSDKSYSYTTTDGHFEVHGLARDSYQVSLQAPGRGRFSSTFDLQSSTEIFVLLDSGRGGRGQSTMTLLKTK
jgi:hypothetical protein